MNDTLVYMAKNPIYRRYEHGALTFIMIYAYNENFKLPLSHDEVVHGKGSLLDKMPGDLWQKFANLRLLYGYMWGHPGKKLLFMGDEVAQWREWNHDVSLDWHLPQWRDHQGIRQLISDLNRVYTCEPSLHEVDFDWRGLDWLVLNDSDNSVLAFLRRAKDPDDIIVVVCNFTPVPRHHYRVGVPKAGFYAELINTDSHIYSGSNTGNNGGVWAQAGGHAGRPYHIDLTIPPLGTLILKPVGARRKKSDQPVPPATSADDDRNFDTFPGYCGRKSRRDRYPLPQGTDQARASPRSVGDRKHPIDLPPTLARRPSDHDPAPHNAWRGQGPPTKRAAP